METLLPLFDESFEIFSKKEQAKKQVDFLLDMCGVPHHRKKVEESSVDGGTFSLNGRPYDAPRQIRIRPVIDIIDTEDESDVAECDEYGASPEMDKFEGAETADGEKEQPAQEPEGKMTNKINNVPNQNAPALLAAVKSDIMEVATNEKMAVMRAAKKFVNPLKKKMDAIQAARKAKGLPPISRKQAARMASIGSV